MSLPSHLQRSVREPDCLDSPKDVPSTTQRPIKPIASSQNGSVANDPRTDDRTSEKQFARACVMSLLRNGLLRGGVEIAQSPLQRRGLIESAVPA